MEKAEELFDVWAEQKCETLGNIHYYLEEYYNEEITDDYPEKTKHELENIKPEIIGEEIFQEKKLSIQRFKESGDISGFRLCNYEDYEEDDWPFCLLVDSEDLCEILEHRSKAKSKIDFFVGVDEMVNRVSEVMAWVEGRYSIRHEQAEERSGSGIGQQQAKSKRISILADSLKDYETGPNEIRIKKNIFRGLVNKTFVGRENYPRHHSVYKIYHKEAENILSKKIILT